MLPHFGATLPRHGCRPPRSETAWLLWIPLVSLATATVAAVALVSSNFWPFLVVLTSHPRDADLFEHFRARCAEFEEARGVALLETGARESLAARLGVLRVRQEEAGSVLLPVSARGLSVSGSQKGFASLPRPPVRLADSLDQPPPAGQRVGAFAFRPIGGGWYLYLEFY